MNTALSPSKLLLSVIAVAALLGGCKKTDVAAPTADTTVTTPSTPVAPASSTDSTAQGSAAMPGAGSTGASGTSGSMGSGDAGSATPAYPAPGNATMPGATPPPADDASKGAVRNNSGQTQGTAGSSLPTSDGSR